MKNNIFTIFVLLSISAIPLAFAQPIDTIYVADEGFKDANGNPQGSIILVNPQTGAQQTFFFDTSDPLQIAGIKDVAVGPDGSVYVSYNGLNLIPPGVVKISADGSSFETYTTSGGITFEDLPGIAYDDNATPSLADDKIFVIDSGFNDPPKLIQCSVTAPLVCDQTYTDSGFSFPFDVAIRNIGTGTEAWVLDLGTTQMFFLDSSGTNFGPSSFNLPSVDYKSKMYFDTQDTVLFTDGEEDDDFNVEPKISKFNVATGTPLPNVSEEQGVFLSGIAIDSSNSIFVSDIGDFDETTDDAVILVVDPNEDDKDENLVTVYSGQPLVTPLGIDIGLFDWVGTPTADLAITKDGPQYGALGHNVDYEITVSVSDETEPIGVDQQLLVIDTYPPGFIFPEGGDTSICQPQAAGQAFCTDFGDVTSSNPQTFTITLFVNDKQSGLLQNSVTVSAAVTDPDDDNDGSVSPPIEIIEGDFCGTPIQQWPNVILGTDGIDSLQGTSDDDLIIGFGGDDVIDGGEGNDCIIGDDPNNPDASGNDVINGNGGDDNISGNSGNDTINGNEGDDTINGDDGADTINGDDGADTLNGGNEDDTIVGGDGIDTINGDNGIDVCFDPKVDTISTCENAEISVTKSDNSPVVAGGDLTYTVDVLNAGPANAIAVNVADILPSEVTFDSASSSDFNNCNLVDGQVTCDPANIPAGETFTLIINTSTEEPGEVTNVVSVSSDTSQSPEFDDSDNEFTLDTTIDPASNDVTLTTIIRDFSKTHPDMQPGCSGGICSGVKTGLVKDTLGLDGKPVFNEDIDSTTGAVNFNQWYNHVPSVNQCTDYEMTFVNTDGTFSFVNGGAPTGEFFPIDGQLGGNEGFDNNYHFTLQAKANFVFANGQEITLNGDDDIFLFIDGILIGDLGGLHPPGVSLTTIELDDLITSGILDINPGDTVSFDLFFAERQTVKSHLEVTTNITLIPVSLGSCDVQSTSAELQLDKTADKETVSEGDELVYTIKLTNNGPATSQAPLTVTDELPGEVVFSEISSEDNFTCSFDSGTVTCQSSNLDAGEMASAEIVVTVDSSEGTITNTADQTPKTNDPFPENNQSTIQTEIEEPGELFCGKPESFYDEVIVGTNKNDKISGTNGNDLIFGKGGNDKIKGKNGDDCIFGGDGNDTINGNNGNDTIFGEKGNDTIRGGNGNDTITGGEGNDNITGHNGNDVISGDDGNDKIRGGNNDDTITGGDGNDNITGHNGNDVISGDDGNDTIRGGNGIDTITGGEGNDYIRGGKGNDDLNGNEGKDNVRGDHGDDLVNGGPENDKLHGGKGYDTCNIFEDNNVNPPKCEVIINQNP